LKKIKDGKISSNPIKMKKLIERVMMLEKTYCGTEKKKDLMKQARNKRAGEHELDNIILRF